MAIDKALRDQLLAGREPQDPFAKGGMIDDGRWRGSGDGEVVWAVSLPAEALRRRGLAGAEVPTGPYPCLPRGERRDRAALRHGQVRGAAQARSAQCPEP